MCGSKDTDGGEKELTTRKKFKVFKGICDTFFGVPARNRTIGFVLRDKKAYLLDLERNQVLYETEAKSGAEVDYLRGVERCYKQRLAAADRARTFDPETGEVCKNFDIDSCRKIILAHESASNGRFRNLKVTCNIL